ncbi:RNA-dependent RNA polymerase, eukaryotic-type [Artemisia annua]|uniref:RNA-dependent RNA polymerase, eukaryotic-type n=1 Tax=Artemisia annua TaxID=35608 RepID=A0A2U1KCA3_ARTAN|nr:RNA-dependent RNA polymerase, eukaryotic-type [Artemisia annua]
MGELQCSNGRVLHYAIGRCNTYRVSIRIRDVPKVKKALAFLEEQGVEIEHNVTQLKVEDGPSFGSWL